MELINLISEIQLNPRNVVVYRKLIKFFKEHGMENEYEAFKNLVEKISDHSDIDT